MPRSVDGRENVVFFFANSFWGSVFFGEFLWHHPERGRSERDPQKGELLFPTHFNTDFKGPEMNIYKISKLSPPKKTASQWIMKVKQRHPKALMILSHCDRFWAEPNIY